MQKKKKLHEKVGENIKNISSFNKNKKKKNNKINQKTSTLLIKGINYKFKHIKPNNENEIGEIKQFEGPIHHSNVRLNLKKVS